MNVWNPFAKRETVAPESRMTLLELLPIYIERVQLGDASLRRYRCELRRWEKVVGIVPIEAITIATFDLFRQRCQQDGLRNGTIESTVKIAKAVLKFCRDRGWLSKLPYFGKPLPVASPSPEPITVAELDAMYRACEVATMNGRGSLSPREWWQAWLVIGYWTGLRVTDLTTHLDWKHILADRIQFQASKTGSQHIYPLCEPVLRALDTMRKAPVDGAIFGGKFFWHERHQLKLICKAAGVRQTIGPKNLRQASVTSWLTADHTAGTLIHGCGLPGVLHHYVGVLRTLSEAAPKFPWPQSMLET